MSWYKIKLTGWGWWLLVMYSYYFKIYIAWGYNIFHGALHKLRRHVPRRNNQTLFGSSSCSIEFGTQAISKRASTIQSPLHLCQNSIKLKFDFPQIYEPTWSPLDLIQMKLDYETSHMVPSLVLKLTLRAKYKGPALVWSC